VVVFVRGDGVGFHTQDAEKLFGVFQRLHSAAGVQGIGA
jgi:light-regulated signal transduction histidine kinase (bacteriophytochrome)